jgi:hypothetical protein
VAWDPGSDRLKGGFVPEKNGSPLPSTGTGLLQCRPFDNLVTDAIVACAINRFEHIAAAR